MLSLCSSMSQDTLQTVNTYFPVGDLPKSVLQFSLSVL